PGTMSGNANIGGFFGTGTFDSSVDGVDFSASFLFGVNRTNGTGGFAGNGRVDSTGLGAIRFISNSTGPGEAILLNFDEQVSLNSLSLVESPNLPGGSTPISIFLDGATTPGATTVAGPGAPTTVSFFDTIVSQILIVNTDSTFPVIQQFRLTALDVSAVPIPAAAWLFGSALAAAGVTRRLSKKRAAA
ncbi:MAG: VPLPA-CTERM sorting domain-containing protein, partial [Pseudomonadota bacterium]